MPRPQVVALYRYPVKGFSAEPLREVEIPAGGTMPFDRAWAIENGPTGFNPAAPSYFPKARFLMLMKNARMAEFRTRFDEATGRLQILADGEVKVEGSLRTESGRKRLETWVLGNFRNELRGPPRILSADSHSFTDKKEKVLHLINLASVRALQDRVGRLVDPLRFRPNIMIDDAPAWCELDWVGAPIRVSKLDCMVESRTSRCAATKVNPTTGRADFDVPAALEAQLGHTDFGVYVVAQADGRIAVGDKVLAPVGAELAATA
jgi:uncharacterized protein YcbX